MSKQTNANSVAAAEQAVTLRTAKAFGIIVPPQMLARADEVIE
jgi:hypothetical protein